MSPRKGVLTRAISRCFYHGWRAGGRLARHTKAMLSTARPHSLRGCLLLSYKLQKSQSYYGRGGETAPWEPGRAGALGSILRQARFQWHSGAGEVGVGGGTVITNPTCPHRQLETRHGSVRAARVGLSTAGGRWWKQCHKDPHVHHRYTPCSLHGIPLVFQGAQTEPCHGRPATLSFIPGRPQSPVLPGSTRLMKPSMAPQHPLLRAPPPSTPGMYRAAVS